MAFASPANIALEGHDPKAPTQLTLAEEEKQYSSEAATEEKDQGYNHVTDAEKSSTDDARFAGLSEHEKELLTARRALRTASWAAVFYLITTDILGPYNAAYSISQLGYVPGVLLYFFMGVVACYTGLILWYLFCRLDSDRFPIKTYSDIAQRIFGGWARHICTVLQSIQLIINVGTICLSNGQSLSQIVVGGGAQLCFSVCIVIWAIIGMLIGQIRTLKNFGWLANSAVFLNLSVIFISMGFVAHSPPNYVAAVNSYGPIVASGPVQTATFVDQTLYNKVNGVMNMVFAYGGAMIFPEFMAEMRRPMDFWKAMCCAQALIFSCYMLYGVFVYTFQGQYTLGIAYQGVSPYAWQTVNNVIGLISGIIAAGLYGNIGIKVAYIHIIEEWFHGPSLLSRRGYFIWAIMVFLYWALAFIIGSAIPQVQTISGLVAATCIMQFTYTFPPALLCGYHVLVDGYGFENSWGEGGAAEFSWRRAFLGGNWKRKLFKLFNFCLFLAAASCACLGMYGSGTAIYAIFQVSNATSFGCGSPVA
ncbi:hypothetical protein DACRYDRAFT_93955 [Dacryopinax primogenitus]|uniref:Amino acid transporter transmembrane domain-containing protein n=1 Tax=Dacryopinax primogenitus (strain DJM 731) TaxID=1858805 RepID=M5GEY4_DACPD|nr:uncharacterized protein DACRYDRAFT_93955 [Dacryopinax primogenitus]EJU03673.1 hypothetical protein DACRYDRAFT_93955 [Dacryopinax primogenitus]